LIVQARLQLAIATLAGAALTHLNLETQPHSKYLFSPQKPNWVSWLFR
jgi:hypothetical protein